MSNPDTAEILMAQPRGFCAGVDRAIQIVNEALTRFGAPIYVRHEIVHNAYVVNELREKGAVFVEELDEVPKGGIVVFSAHGVSQAVRQDAKERGLQVYDATCPLVTKVHLEVVKMCQEGFTILMIGHAGHPEVEGTMGQAKEGVFLIEKLAETVAGVCLNDSKVKGVMVRVTKPGALDMAHSASVEICRRRGVK